MRIIQQGINRVWCPQNYYHSEGQGVEEKINGGDGGRGRHFLKACPLVVLAEQR
jgi:hypothetical protein